MSAHKCAGAAMSRALLYPIPDWPALSCGLRQAVLRESWGRAFRETAVQPRRRFVQFAVPVGLCGRVLEGCG